MESKSDSLRPTDESQSAAISKKKRVHPFKTVTSYDATRIVSLISKKPSYSMEISRALGIDRQKVYYYIRNLEKAGIIGVKEVIRLRGSYAKVYEKNIDSIMFSFESGSITGSTSESANFSAIPALYHNFIMDRKFDGYICVGSPDPHGKYKSIARDAHMGTYLGMFLGHFCSLPDYYPIALDTDIVAKNLLKNNLIIIGGPITNVITRMLNVYFPVKFRQNEGWMLSSGDQIYQKENIGVVEKISNPYDKTKEIVLIAGNKNSGTLAAILSATKFLHQIDSRLETSAEHYAMVEGYDVDGDGVIDAVDIIE